MVEFYVCEMGWEYLFKSACLKNLDIDVFCFCYNFWCSNNFVVSDTDSLYSPTEEIQHGRGAKGFLFNCLWLWDVNKCRYLPISNCIWQNQIQLYKCSLIRFCKSISSIIILLYAMQCILILISCLQITTPINITIYFIKKIVKTT